MNKYQTKEQEKMAAHWKEWDLVKITRGDLLYTDNYSLSKLIQFGTDAEKSCAGSEWERRTGKPFPYHPSYENDSYLTAHGNMVKEESDEKP